MSETWDAPICLPKIKFFYTSKNNYCNDWKKAHNHVSNDADSFDVEINEVHLFAIFHNEIIRTVILKTLFKLKKCLEYE